MNDYLAKLTRIERNSTFSDVVTAQRLNAIQDAIKALAKGENLMAGEGTALRRSTTGVTISGLGPDTMRARQYNQFVYHADGMDEAIKTIGQDPGKKTPTHGRCKTPVENSEWYNGERLLRHGGMHKIDGIPIPYNNPGANAADPDNCDPETSYSGREDSLNVTLSLRDFNIQGNHVARLVNDGMPRHNLNVDGTIGAPVEEPEPSQYIEFLDTGIYEITVDSSSMLKLDDCDPAYNYHNMTLMKWAAIGTSGQDGVEQDPDQYDGDPFETQASQPEGIIPKASVLTETINTSKRYPQDTKAAIEFSFRSHGVDHCISHEVHFRPNYKPRFANCGQPNVPGQHYVTPYCCVGSWQGCAGGEMGKQTNPAGAYLIPNMCELNSICVCDDPEIPPGYTLVQEIVKIPTFKQTTFKVITNIQDNPITIPILENANIEFTKLVQNVEVTIPILENVLIEYAYVTNSVQIEIPKFESVPVAQVVSESEYTIPVLENVLLEYAYVTDYADAIIPKFEDVTVAKSVSLDEYTIPVLENVLLEYSWVDSIETVTVGQTTSQPIWLEQTTCAPPVWLQQTTCVPIPGQNIVLQIANKVPTFENIQLYTFVPSGHNYISCSPRTVNISDYISINNHTVTTVIAATTVVVSPTTSTGVVTVATTVVVVNSVTTTGACVCTIGESGALTGTVTIDSTCFHIEGGDYSLSSPYGDGEGDNPEPAESGDPCYNADDPMEDYSYADPCCCYLEGEAPTLEGGCSTWVTIPSHTHSCNCVITMNPHTHTTVAHTHVAALVMTAHTHAAVAHTHVAVSTITDHVIVNIQQFTFHECTDTGIDIPKPVEEPLLSVATGWNWENTNVNVNIPGLSGCVQLPPVSISSCVQLPPVRVWEAIDDIPLSIDIPHLQTNSYVFPQWVDDVTVSVPTIEEATACLCYDPKTFTIYDLETNTYEFPQWVSDVAVTIPLLTTVDACYCYDAYPYTIHEMETNSYVFPQWVDDATISIPEVAVNENMVVPQWVGDFAVTIPTITTADMTVCECDDFIEVMVPKVVEDHYAYEIPPLIPVTTYPCCEDFPKRGQGCPCVEKQAPGVWTDGDSTTFFLEVTRKHVESGSGAGDSREKGNKIGWHIKPSEDLEIRVMDPNWAWDYDSERGDYRVNRGNSPLRHLHNSLSFHAQTAHYEWESMEHPTADCRWRDKQAEITKFKVTIRRHGPIENPWWIDRPADLESDMSTQRGNKPEAQFSGSSY